MLTNSHYRYLSERWKRKQGELQKQLWGKHRESLEWLSNNYRHLVAGSLGGLMLLQNANINLPIPNAIAFKSSVPNIDKRAFLISDLSKVLPNTVAPLTLDQEQKISQILTRDFGFKVVPELEGKKLNRSYGLMGAEQHLARFP